MCARFELNVSDRGVVDRFGLRVPPGMDPVQTGLARLPLADIRPTDRVPVIGPRRLPVALVWGLAVDWDRKPLINARAETLAEKATFRGLVGNRCLVPATAFFEWSEEPEAASEHAVLKRQRRRRHRIARSDGALHAMAGLVDAASGRFTIITRAANEQMAAIHGRMPVILDPDAEEAWLDPGRSFASVRSLLAGWNGDLAIDPSPSTGPGLPDQTLNDPMSVS